MNDTAQLLETVEHETRPDPTWTVIWLHGLGADGNDFAPIVPELVRKDWPGLRFVFPHAPMRAVALAAGLRRSKPRAGLVALSTYLPLSTAALAGLDTLWSRSA